MSGQTLEQLPFSADFAARVLREADSVRRRTRARLFAAAGAALVVIGAGAFWSMPRNADRALPGTVAFDSGGGALAFASTSGQTDPLSYMFPDAQPLAQFSDEYASATSGGAMQRQQLLFADQEPARAAADF